MPPMLRRADHAAGSNARWFNSNTLADRDGYPTRNCAGHRDKGSDDGDEPEPARALPTDGVPDALLDECRVGPSVAHEGERAAALYVHRDVIEDRRRAVAAARRIREGKMLNLEDRLLHREVRHAPQRARASLA